METKPPEQTTSDAATAAPTLQPTTPVTTEPRNYLATFLFTMLGGYIGLRHFYLGDSKLGWLRAGLFVGGYIWILLMAATNQVALSLLGSIAIVIAMVWAVVDFFYVYFTVRTDHDGQPLVSTVRDRKWAKILFWVTVGFSAFAIITSISLFSWAENEFRSNPFRSDFNDSRFDSSGPSRFENEYRFDSSDL